MSRARGLLWILVMIGCSWGTSTAGPAGVPAGLTSKVVEVRGGADLPEFLLTDEQVMGLPYFKAHKHESRKHKEKIVGFNGSAELSVRRTRRYVTPDGYEGTEGNTLAEAMKLPEERGGLKLSRWVVCSWVIANISAAEALRARSIPFLDNIPELLRSVQNLSPSQVYAVAAANITMGFTFSGVNSSSLTPAAEEALKEAASDLAGGYSKSLITVSTSPPAAATSSQMEGKVQVQDTPDVVKRGKDLGQPAPALGTNGRRLQQAAEVSWQQGVLEVSGSQHMRQRAAVASALHRRLLQSASAAAAAPPAAPAASSSSSSGELSVWLLYKHVAPANTSTLLTELCVSCNITPTAAAGTELTSRPCGVEVREALVGAGVGVDDATYSQTLSAPPTVSLSVRLAIGMTPAQVAAGDDVALAQWLAQPETTQAMARMYAPDAVVRWLHSPEVWYQKLAPPPPVLSPGAAAGVAVGGMAALCGVVGLAVWLLHRRKQQNNPADKDDGASSQGSGRRRRRQGKRRYLLPEPPRPGSQSHDDQAGPSSSGAAAAAGGSQEGSLGDDEEPSPDQIRPHLRSLGDSVTSAVRFEQSDEEEEADANANQDHAEGSAGASSSHAAAGAAGAAAAAAAVAAAAAAGTSGSRPAADVSSSTPASSRSVLAARAAVLAEHQQAANRPAGSTEGRQAALAASSSSSSSSTAQACDRGGRVSGAGSPAFAAVPSVPGAVSPELAAAADMSSAVGTSSAPSIAPKQPCATSATAAAAAADGSVPGHTQQTPCLLKPVDERAAAASAAAVAAAAALPLAGAVAHPTSRRASPFAMSYNFDGLADSHPPAAAAAGSPVSLPGCADPALAAAAMVAASVRAVALPPRNVPLSPVCSPRSPLSAQPAGPPAAAPHNGALSPQDAAATACGGSASASSISSSTSSGQQQQLQLGALASSRSGGSPSSSGGLPSSPLDSSSGKKGVGLQQLVSVTSLRAPEAAAAAAAGAGACPAGTQQLNGTAYVPGFQHQPETLWSRSHSDCTSVLPSDSYQSTLQLSSSMSGPVLQPCSTNCVGPLSQRQSCEERVQDSSSVGEVGFRP